MRNLILSLFLFLSYVSHVYAAPSLLSKLNIFSNASKPEVWNDQLGGFATGGSFYARTPTTNLQLLTIDPPSLDIGCGGINAFFGGFGYINSAKFEELIKNIGTSTTSYVTMLAFKTISPQVSNLLENLEATARFINSQNINSCQMGASIASGMFMKNEQSQRLACQARKMGGGGVGEKAANYFTARYECGSEDNLRSTNQNGQESLLPSEFNLVWFALQKDASALSKEDKEFLMSLSGTLIAKTSGKSIAFENKSSLVQNEKLLDAWIFGTKSGEHKIYVCDTEDKCLNPRTRDHVVKKEDAILYKIQKNISSLEQKIVEENAGVSALLSAEEKDLVTKSSIPILKLISLNAALKGHGVRRTVDDYADAIAFDYVLGYADSLLDFVYSALSSVEHNQIEGESIRAFKEDLRHLKHRMYQDRINAFSRLNTLLSAKNSIHQIESMVLNSFAEYRGA